MRIQRLGFHPCEQRRMNEEGNLSCTTFNSVCALLPDTSSVSGSTGHSFYPVD